MSQSVKRVVNAFILGFLAALISLALQNWLTISNAVNVQDWIGLRNVGLSVLAGAIFAALRAVQAYVPPVPSPEPDENVKK